MSLIPLDSDQYSRIPFTRFPLINAVIAQEQSGKIFINAAAEPFIIHRACFSFVGTTGGFGTGNSFLELIASEYIPTYFHIYDAPDLVERALQQAENIFNYKVRKRAQLRLPPNYLAAYSSNIPSGFQLEVLNDSNVDCVGDLGMDLENKFWDSKDHFLTKGIGVCIFNDAHQAVCICYSACVANNVAEIDVKTDSHYQRKGLAITAVKEFIRICKQKEVIPNWDCFKDNVGSMETALKAGFKVDYEYPFLSIFNKKKHI